MKRQLAVASAACSGIQPTPQLTRSTSPRFEPCAPSPARVNAALAASVVAPKLCATATPTNGSTEPEPGWWSASSRAPSLACRRVSPVGSRAPA